MHSRTDYSNYLYHWIKPSKPFNTQEDAYEQAYNIMEEIFDAGYLKASGRDTYKKIESVCFTESPAEIMKSQNSKYQPFGFAFLKSDIFDMGGRHVIYQTKDEAKFLPASMLWRHVTYNPQDVGPSKPNGIDFTWEREWRLNVKKLDILDCHSVILPNEYWIERLKEDIQRWKEFPARMWRDIGVSTDPGPYPKYTPDYIECFNALYTEK
ncbi:hypothetical protein K1Y37_09130 [Serratia marcescens]|uniref:hypothetical protein n=1 Tax=Serratia marcescens TaxID=615 RepID=UPI001FB6263B|nr:hypothetical protein [Serratia marcescens]MCW6023048.1 hypothetical protein [Serratia marcescens]UOG72109.1 hypothetical protein MJ023_002037 [Serratia marcescens]